MLKNREKAYFYEVDLTWNSSQSSTINILGVPSIEIITPSAFNTGIKNNWTTEHLLASAVSCSLMTNFLTITEVHHLEIMGYKSHCFVKVEKKIGKLETSEILICPIITLLSDQELTKALSLIDKATRSFSMKNILRLNLEVHPQFEFLNERQSPFGTDEYEKSS